ncbi:MAG: DUF4178 domain-containing protein [Acidobacteria bacterium]|nr:DUF4178 domain-containing protein [Acidobacteriota bacterium]
MVATAPLTRGFNCANCGAAVELRALQHTRAVACTSCAAIIDPRDPTVFVLQTAAARERITPVIPLGTRGTWDGQPCEVVGFQRRSIEVDDTRYGWDEYVLFNPYRGFRYLSEYEGHWNDIRTVRELPRLESSGKRTKISYRGESYAHFQGATARTDFVLGEFPWRVRTGDEVRTADYIAPPQMLSSESTDDETTWSIGRYTEAAEIWKAFSLQGEPRSASGVFANQPSPYGKRLKRSAAVFALLAGLLALFVVVRLVSADRERVLSERYVWRPGAGEPAFVTAPFALREPGTVEIALGASVQNAWLGVDLALINVDSGTAWNVSREVSFYTGRDSDGAWTEGSRSSRVLLPAVPAGQYYLRVEPEGPTTSPQVPYTIQVRRDVPSLLPYGIAILLLLVPPVANLLRMASFEHRRLQESDHSA